VRGLDQVTRVTGDPPCRRRGIYIISDDQLTRALRLPPGQQITGARTSFSRLAILVQVEGDDLPEVLPGQEAPTVGGGYGSIAYYPLHADQAAQLDPGQLHTAVLALLDVVHLEDADALAGRQRIIVRHAPRLHRVRLDDNGAVYRAGSVQKDTDNAHRALCQPCGDGHHDQRGALWPCPDYRDASAGLVDWPPT
jgi:hypothetical protein